MIISHLDTSRKIKQRDYQMTVIYLEKPVVGYSVPPSGTDVSRRLGIVYVHSLPRYYDVANF
ncbi:MAG TPA: hypothetical protein PLP19_20690 [bacterium]|nr:hypothetical protein [bacterium]HPN45914.1 hypothetical protein [bacterium]